MMRHLMASLFAVCLGTGAKAQTVIDDWDKVRVPPAPVLKAATVDAGTTALLLLDFNGHETPQSGPCNAETKPRCLASLPRVRALLDRARASGIPVIYSVSQNGTPADIRPEVAPLPGETVVKGGPDKFIGTDLRDQLAARRIATVIVAGTASEGAVLNTGTDAALHGLKVVVPVDGMSSTLPYAEQYVAWHVTAAPGLSPMVTLTRSDLIDVR